MRKVVVTGIGLVSPLGNTIEEFQKALMSKQSGVVLMPKWDDVEGLRTRLAGKVTFEEPEYYPRKKTRAMGSVALYATSATESALTDAGLISDDILKSGRTGIAYGSCAGSPEALAHFIKLRTDRILKGITSTTYIKSMSHTCAANISLFFEICGRIIPTCSACTSATQAIGYGYESIKYGLQDVMVCGGAEELCVSIAGVFDVLYATSANTNDPIVSPRPFDKKRDGLVVAEGAGTLILEEEKHAKARGAKIYGEIVGFGTNSDAVHITNPCSERMCQAMELAVSSAGISPSAIGYVSSHATGTELGDIAESLATSKLFGSQVLISSLKSYTGHTLGACGAIESIASLLMLNSNWYAPNLHLDELDERCADLEYVVGDGVNAELEYVMKNNFAFGGVNASLIFKKV